MMTKEEIAKLPKGYHPNIKLMDLNKKQGRGKSIPDIFRIDKLLSKFFGHSPTSDPIGL